MKTEFLNRKHILFLMSIMLYGLSAFTQNQYYFIEAEDFKFYNGWAQVKDGGASKLVLMANNQLSSAEALTVIEIKKSGNYNFWVRSRDFAKNRPGTRTFRLYVENEPMPSELGKHNKEGYYWERAGSKYLNQGNIVLSLKEAMASARFDAVIVTLDERFNPNQTKIADLSTFDVKPVQQIINTISKNVNENLLELDKIKIDTLAKLSNTNIRLNFLRVRNPKDTVKIISSLDIFKNGSWFNVTGNKESSPIYLQKSVLPEINLNSFYPAWKGTSTPRSSFSLNGNNYRFVRQEDAENPFYAGEIQECKPVKVLLDANKAKLNVIYETPDGTKIDGFWELSPQGNHVSLSLKMISKSSAYYSFIVSAFQQNDGNTIKNVQLPPMFQYQRIPSAPVLVPSTLTPHPMAIAELDINKQSYSQFVAGAPEHFNKDDWGTKADSPFGFSIINNFNKVQPIAFSPILGLKDSKIAYGDTLERSFIIGGIWGGWDTALEYISAKIFEVRDYRSQKETSLTDAVFNMFDLLKKDEYNGWDSKMKGFYDIEQNPPVVVQASPLAVVSAAVLQRDEDLYIQKALPTIEYTLSRRGFRWSNKAFTRFMPNKSSLEMGPYSNFFNTAYLEGLYNLSGRLNPWLIDLALPEGKLRKTDGYGVAIPAWTQALAAYRLTENENWLKIAVYGADKFLKEDVYAKKTKPLEIEPFYNGSFYSYWWDLPDLYEATKDEKYLDAAAYTSFQTLAGIRSYPTLRNEMQTIHPGNKFEGVSFMWWKKNDRFRLGYPRTAGDAKEKKVEASLVSPVGLGLEQPVTFYPATGTVKHIMMANWAPALLRLYQYQPRSIWHTYSRNAIIGRYANYPGYYAPGFTDLYLKEDYPYAGPDVTSIYYHHIPAQLALSIDFLVTEAVQRSAGKISFPWSKQEGFVWFNNRIYGGGKGTVFHDKKVRLWLKKDLVKTDNPRVNYITGISDENFWIVLLNEDSVENTVSIALSDAVPIKSNAKGQVYTDDGKSSTVQLNAHDKKLQVSVGGQKYTAISFPVNAISVKEEKPVADGMKQIDLGNPWGKFYAFRIRSPFGWDSFYGYLSNPAPEGSQVKLIRNGKSNKKEGLVTEYPYEWSLVKIAPNETISLELQLKAANGSEILIPIDFGAN